MRCKICDFSPHTPSLSYIKDETNKNKNILVDNDLCLHCQEAEQAILEDYKKEQDKAKPHEKDFVEDIDDSINDLVDPIYSEAA